MGWSSAELMKAKAETVAGDGGAGIAEAPPLHREEVYDPVSDTTITVWSDSAWTVPPQAA